MNRMSLPALAGLLAVTGATAVSQKVVVPLAPEPSAHEQSFRDGRFGVSFRVPAGWDFSRKDGLVSTFHADARTAPNAANLRGVAILSFNPYPLSTLSGALFYYSVARHSNDLECARQAIVDTRPPDLQDIGGMTFAHGHDEHGGICTEARDEIYTAYRRGACYRFDLTTNTFCSISSGAQELSDDELRSVVERMTGILSSVGLQWEKSGPHFVPAPVPAAEQARPAGPERQKLSAPAAAAGAGDRR